MSYELRIEMAKLGWDSDDRLTKFGWGLKGERGYTAMFDRWDWHGVRLGSPVSFSASVSPSNLSPESIEEAWKRVAAKAQSAWNDFTDCLPMTTADGVVRRDDTLTPIIESVHGGNPWRKDAAGNAT